MRSDAQACVRVLKQDFAHSVLHWQIMCRHEISACMPQCFVLVYPATVALDSVLVWTDKHAVSRLQDMQVIPAGASGRGLGYA